MEVGGEDAPLLACSHLPSSRTSDFPPPSFRGIYGWKSIIHRRKFGRRESDTGLNSPIEIVDAVDHRIRESTEAILQIGTHFRMLMLTKYPSPTVSGMQRRFPRLLEYRVLVLPGRVSCSLRATL